MVGDSTKPEESESLVNSEGCKAQVKNSPIYSESESLVNSEGCKAMIISTQILTRLRALLIQKGVKLEWLGIG